MLKTISYKNAEKILYLFYQFCMINKIYIKDKDNKMRYITIEEIVAINRIVTNDSDLTINNMFNLPALEAALGAANQTVFEREVYPTIPEKALKLFDVIIRRHPFKDGNKRTAFLALMTWLAMNNRIENSKWNQHVILDLINKSRFDRLMIERDAATVNDCFKLVIVNRESDGTRMQRLLTTYEKTLNLIDQIGR